MRTIWGGSKDREDAAGYKIPCQWAGIGAHEFYGPLRFDGNAASRFRQIVIGSRRGAEKAGCLVGYLAWKRQCAKILTRSE